MELSVSQEMGRRPITVFRLQGQLNLGSVDDLARTAHSAYQEGMRDLIIDLSEVSSLSSAGLRAIHGIYTMLGGFPLGEAPAPHRSPHLKVVNPPAAIRRVLQVAGFDSFIEIHDDLQTAVGSF